MAYMKIWSGRVGFREVVRFLVRNEGLKWFQKIYQLWNDHVHILLCLRGQRARPNEMPGFDINSGSPYSERPSTAHRDDATNKQTEAGLQELDSDKNMPESVDKEVWARFCGYRRQKVGAVVLKCFPV